MTYCANWSYPTQIRVGAGRIDELADTCRLLNLKSPMLVTDPGLANLPIIEKILHKVRICGINCGLFFDIQSNPIGENIEDGVTFYHDNLHDGIIAVGGGSALDAGKAIGLMVGQNKPLWDFEDIGDNWNQVNIAGMAPVIAVPTTAGTGSEVGRASVITDTEQKCKKVIFHPAMLPDQVILDPQLTIDLPATLTAVTGMDALSHNLEALCSPHYHPMATGIATEGIRMVQQYLPRAFLDGSDIEARTQMLVCSSMGATAFQKGLGAMHALAHPLGANYDIHHGTLNAIVMPYVLKANRPAIEQQIADLSEYMGLSEKGFDGFLSWILDLRSQLGIPHTLAEIGLEHSAAVKIGCMAVEDPSASGNPVQFSAEQYQQLYSDAVNGAL